MTTVLDHFSYSNQPFLWCERLSSRSGSYKPSFKTRYNFLLGMQAGGPPNIDSDKSILLESICLKNPWQGAPRVRAYYLELLCRWAQKGDRVTGCLKEKTAQCTGWAKLCSRVLTAEITSHFPGLSVLSFLVNNGLVTGPSS